MQNQNIFSYLEPVIPAFAGMAGIIFLVLSKFCNDKGRLKIKFSDGLYPIYQNKTECLTVKSRDNYSDISAMEEAKKLEKSQPPTSGTIIPTYCRFCIQCCYNVLIPDEWGNYSDYKAGVAQAMATAS